MSQTDSLRKQRSDSVKQIRLLRYRRLSRTWDEPVSTFPRVLILFFADPFTPQAALGQTRQLVRVTVVLSPPMNVLEVAVLYG